MRLVNIHSKNRTLYLFKRDNEGRQIVNTVKDFYPYLYETYADENIVMKSYTNAPVKKIICSNPNELNKNRTNKSWEADVSFTKRYLLDKVEALDKCPIKWTMIDIEIQAKELPDVMEAKYPISCVTLYNNFKKEYKTFYIKEYESEYKLIEDFIAYLQKEKFDLIIGWNIEKFDYPYIANRFPDFTEKISPINQSRWSATGSYPAGISIVDYYNWFRNITAGREVSYKLDDIAQKYLKHESKGEFDFSKASKEVKEKNILDVQQLVELEEKFKLIPYFDEVRRLAKIEWEDCLWSSRILDQLLLQEAKNQNIVLPMKPNEERGTLEEKAEYEGAYREIFKTGRFENVTKYDLSGAYPTMIKDFCLDSSNVRKQKEKNTVEIENNYYKQNANAILPLIINKLLILKNKIKDELNATDPSLPVYKDLAMKYRAIKGIVNSSYGVFGNRFFRLYDIRVASATTFLVRSLMKYTIDKIKEKGYDVLYVDTDSLFIQSEENLTETLNNIIQEWAQSQFKKDKINLEFTYEGKFTKLLLMALCRYIGYLDTASGVKKEICGVEAKRKDSTEFMKKFQEDLIDLILNDKEQEEVINWINAQKEEIKKANLEDIGFPCKLARQIEDYKNCYSEDTEILTECGWKLLKDIVDNREKIKVATLNTKYNQVEYQYPIDYICNEYSGKLFNDESKSINLLVTPENRMYVAPWHRNKFKKIEAKNLPSDYKYLREFPYKGTEEKYFKYYIYKNKTWKYQKSNKKKLIKMDYWLDFLGWFLSEGYLVGQPKNTYQIRIAQRKKENFPIIHKMLKNLGFHYNHNTYGGYFSFHSKEIYEYLFFLNGCKNKKIPREILNLSKRQLKILFHSLMLGDGHIDKKNRYIYYSTISKQLAEDVYELGLKVGLTCFIRKIKGRKRSKHSKMGNLVYMIHFSRRKYGYTQKQNRKYVDYKGKVYDLTVPNDLLYIRRKYHSCWSCNCPIFVRALQNTINFERTVGDGYYYIYVIAKETDEKGKPKDVVAFDNKIKDHVEDIDWYKVIDRNIIAKADMIFKALNWESSKILQNKPIRIKLKKDIVKSLNDNQETLF